MGDTQEPINMKSNVGHMTFRQRLVIIILALIAVISLGLLIISTLQIKEKAERGEGYVTTIAPGSPGPKGEKGDSPTPAEIRQAVTDYCAASGVCDGQAPSQAVVFAAVTQFCSDGRCRGSTGERGTDATPVTPAQIREQVLAYCSNGNCKGDTGSTGATGAAGATGKDGRSMTMACVLVTENSTPVRYYSAKYTDEANSAYLTWPYRSRLPTWFVPNDCIDMRGV